MTNIHNREVIYTPRCDISCAGTDEVNDHPTIYLQIDKNIKELACPYCNRLFKLTI